MKAFTAASAAILGMVGLASAHMEMKDPPPFRSKFNSHTTDIDYSMTNPLNRDGSDFPCKGYHNLVGTPQGASVANWTPGQSLTMTITGGTPHNGGSCQASLSYDGGSTWTAIHSYYGNCPVMGDSSYAFTLPNDTPAGQALFGWSWFNQIGNREMYMNCAVVTIGSAKRDLIVRGPQDSFHSRPAMFVANVGNGCSTVEGTDVQFPSPGPDVTNVSNKLGAPVGSCGARKAAPIAGSKRSTPEAASTLLTATRPAPTAATKDDESVGPFAEGASCDQEGAWNCVDGATFQRCASGTWTDVEEVYPGTACKVGVSTQLSVAREKSPPVNYERVLRQTREAELKAKNN